MLVLWARQYRGRPRAELHQLLLLALERERLVTVAYSDGGFLARLEALDRQGDFPGLLQQAMRWTWKDEETHSVYIGGLLSKMGTPWLRMKAQSQEIAGIIAGWASSAQQHLRWRDAPFSRTAATAVTGVGKLMGKVPRAAREHLRKLTLREYCLLQMDAENTAAVCWRRIAELAGQPPGFDAETCREFQRIADDEDRHRLVFEAIGDHLDDDDGLRDAGTLVERLRAIGEPFVVRKHRKGGAGSNPMGRGGRVWCVQGGPADGKRAVFRRILSESGLEAQVAEIARATGKPASALKVVVKPVFMLGYDKRDRSGVTDPELVDELALFLREQGCSDIAVGEGRTVYDNFHGNRTVEEVARYFGFDAPSYRVTDFSLDQVPHRYPHGLGQHSVSRAWKEADVRIVFGKLRSHPVDFSHCVLGALQGIGSRLEEFLFAEAMADRDMALLMPLEEFPAHFALVDGYDSAADGLAGVVGCANAPAPRRLYGGNDALAVDFVATRHMGLPEPRDSLLLRSACLWFGDPTGAIEVVGTDEPIPGWRHPHCNGLSILLSRMAFPAYRHMSNRGAVFLPSFDEAAFPPLQRAGLGLRFGRSVARRILGLRAPR